uniref:Glutamic acid-rich protein-like n=1 Tax=Diabrotica virgifera virgifera TaxID=50390 RepID=A0A6P7HCN9_DIAVI
MDRVRVRNPKSLTQDELRAMAEALFEEEPEEEVRGEEDASSSEEEEEITEDNDYNTESEIELNDKESSDSDNESDGESLESDEDEYFIAKDKQTKWYKNSVVSKFSKTSSKNIVKILPG